MNLPAIDARLVCGIVGLVLLALGAYRLFGPRRNAIQGRIWALTGLIFCAVALFLRLFSQRNPFI